MKAIDCRDFFFSVLSLMLLSCSDGNNHSSVDTTVPYREYDFSAADQALQELVDRHEAFDGSSMIIVHKDRGVIHRAAVGTHDLDTISLLASSSKMISATLLMTLAEDDGLNFDINLPVENYLPADWDPLYTGFTTEQILSNASGLPGLIPLVPEFSCQHGFGNPDQTLMECVEYILHTPINQNRFPVLAPNTKFQYGGAQWQIAGAVAELVSSMYWNDILRERILEPCELEVLTYGNPYGVFIDNPPAWTGTVDSLPGQMNPSISGGAIASMDDYAKLLLMHLNDGMCGENRVLTKSAVEFMRVDRGSAIGSVEQTGQGYGLGWSIEPPAEGEEATLFYDNGLFGTTVWIDTARGYGVFLSLQHIAVDVEGDGRDDVKTIIQPLIESEIDRNLLQIY